jgi:acetyltransferase-like isoleucine patch superfamily enzyme
LKLMDSVYIDRDVYVDDAAKVEIGARSWVGAGTQILTSAPCSDLVDRKGTGTERTAEMVVIESEVQIGAGCVIYPGVRLGRGCHVRPGSVVNVSVEGNKTFEPNEATMAGERGYGLG